VNGVEQQIGQTALCQEIGQWPTGREDHSIRGPRQRSRVHRPRPWAMVQKQRDDHGLPRARCTVAERCCRILQRPVPGWVPEHRVVHDGCRGPGLGWFLALGVQQPKALRDFVYKPPSALQGPMPLEAAQAVAVYPNHSHCAWTNEVGHVTAITASKIPQASARTAADVPGPGGVCRLMALPLAGTVSAGQISFC